MFYSVRLFPFPVHSFRVIIAFSLTEPAMIYHSPKLDSLIPSLNAAERFGLENPTITSIAYDSREVEPGGIFFALEGSHTDGHRFIEAAADRGAAAVVHSRRLDVRRPGIVYLRVQNTRNALSPLSAEFWGRPSGDMNVIGVTGTDGKSTTVGLIHQLLQLTGCSSGSISTVGFNMGESLEVNPRRQSTPEAPEIHALLRAMLDAGKHYAVLEATSHALSPRNSRLADVDFDAAVFTNVTSEHLDFHGDLETYRADKARLFEAAAASNKPEAFGVVNADDPHAEMFITAAGERPVFTYSLRCRDVDLRASNCALEPSGTSFTLITPTGSRDVFINLPGLYNVENTLAALCTAAEIQNEDPLEFADLCPKLRGIKGRMEPISGNMPFNVIVDYAHSPGSFAKILPFLKGLAESSQSSSSGKNIKSGKSAGGRLIAVFGSAGERDIDKRSEQGRLASLHADIIILTEEDPRGEDPMKILEDIAVGAEGSREMRRGGTLFLIPDRRDAIRRAFAAAQPGDTAVFLGKGHETSIIRADGPHRWDEAEECRFALRELGYQA